MCLMNSIDYSSVENFCAMERDYIFLEMIRNQPCSVCGKKPPSDPSHIRSRGAGGKDEKWNVFPMCRRHHIEWHNITHYKFFKRYPNFYYILMHYGWYIDDNHRLRRGN